MTKELSHFIDGARVPGRSGRFADVYNPATGEVTARVPLAAAAEVAAPPARWVQVLFLFRELLYKHLADLAAQLSAEHGKTLADAKGEVTRGLEVVEFACGIPQLLKGEYSDQVGAAGDS